MKNQELSRQLQRLNKLISRTQQATQGDVEMQSHWAKYICVLAAGFIENSLTQIYGEFCSRAASPPVADFANSFLAGIQNPKASRFAEIAGRFKASWRADLEKFLSDEGRKEAIDSIMANRHLIAHGKDSGITIARLKDYLSKALEALEFIELQCL